MREAMVMETRPRSNPADANEELAEERISLGCPEQVQQWAAKLGISADHLRELIAQAGPRVRDVKQRLSEPEVQD
jgi:hypothetical protein